MSNNSEKNQSWAPLADMSEDSITELMEAAKEKPALSRSLARLLRDLNDPNGVISAFSAFAS